MLQHICKAQWWTEVATKVQCMSRCAKHWYKVHRMNKAGKQGQAGKIVGKKCANYNVETRVFVMIYILIKCAKHTKGVRYCHHVHCEQGIAL
jgi:hypothetical protein